MSSIEAKEGSLPGLLELRPTVHTDERGTLVKTFREDWFTELGISPIWPERFYSRSDRGVVRGMHFQAPPSEHDKIVYCVRGTLMDVVVDLRVGSPTYGNFDVCVLDDESWLTLFIPKGLAHGFAALEDGAVIAYATSTPYDASLDAGIRWNSLPIPWPFEKPLLSPRDAALPPFVDYESPFSYGT